MKTIIGYLPALLAIASIAYMVFAISPAIIKIQHGYSALSQYQQGM